MKSILTVECIKLTGSDNEEAGHDSIEVDGWLYQFCPLPASLFEYEMQLDGINNTAFMLFESSEALHAEMQKIIAAGRTHFTRYGNHHVVHLVTNESSGEWKIEISYIGLLDLNKL